MSDPAPVSRNAQRHLDLIRHHEETLARYQAETAVAEWLRQFRADGAHFLERYATERASALVDGRQFWDLNQREEASLVQEATERLWEIQQRKLFELQCRWRAEEVRLPAELVVLSQDFERWGTRIEQCPLVPPIAAAEVESYLAYLLSDACTDADDDSGRPHEWQNYERFRRYLLLQAEGENPEQVRREAGRHPEPGLGGLMGMLDDFFLDYPAWYAHCDAVAGPPNLVLYLPDHRGEKEQYYLHLGRTGKAPSVYEQPDDDDDEPAPADPAPTAPAADPPPRYLHYDQFADLTDTLMRKFETPELLRFHEALLHEPALAPMPAPGTDDDDDDDEQEDDENEAALAELGAEAGRALLEIPERLPIEAHPDWRVALHRTWLGWRKQQLATALRGAYADYATREQAGQPHPSPYPESDISDLTHKAWKQVRKRILKGREQAGEPRDFNF